MWSWGKGSSPSSCITCGARMHYSLLYCLAFLVGNNCRNKLHWNNRLEFHQATANFRGSNELICGHEGVARRWRHPAPRRLWRHVMRGRVCDWFYLQERDRNINVFWSMKTQALLQTEYRYTTGHCDVPWCHAIPHSRKAHIWSRGERTAVTWAYKPQYAKNVWFLLTQILTYSLQHPSQILGFNIIHKREGNVDICGRRYPLGVKACLRNLGWPRRQTRDCRQNKKLIRAWIYSQFSFWS